MSLDPRILISVLRNSDLTSRRGVIKFVKNIVLVIIATSLAGGGFVATGLYYQALDSQLTPRSMEVQDSLRAMK